MLWYCTSDSDVTAVWMPDLTRERNTPPLVTAAPKVNSYEKFLYLRTCVLALGKGGFNVLQLGCGKLSTGAWTPGTLSMWVFVHKQRQP